MLSITKWTGVVVQDRNSVCKELFDSTELELQADDGAEAISSDDHSSSLLCPLLCFLPKKAMIEVDGFGQEAVTASIM